MVDDRLHPHALRVDYDDSDRPGKGPAASAASAPDRYSDFAFRNILGFDSAAETETEAQSGDHLGGRDDGDVPSEMNLRSSSREI